MQTDRWERSLPCPDVERAASCLRPFGLELGLHVSLGLLEGAKKPTAQTRLATSVEERFNISTASVDVNQIRLADR